MGYRQPTPPYDWEDEKERRHQARAKEDRQQRRREANLEELGAHAKLTGMLLWYGGFLAFILAVSATIVALTKPVWLGFERRASVASLQYTEARRTEIIADIAQYDSLAVQIAKNKDNAAVVEALESQQRSLATKIRAAMAKIPEDAWPEGARRFE